jgi:hypothetical protein
MTVTRIHKSDQFLGATVALALVAATEAGFDLTWWAYALAAVLCFAWGFRHYYKATVR